MQSKSIKGRRCWKCGELKPLTQFKTVALRVGESPKKPLCKSCEALVASNAEGLEGLKWDTPEYQKRYRELHRERRIALSKRWREQNPERVRETERQWRAENPEKVRAFTTKRGTRRRNAGGVCTARDLLQMYEDQEGLCAYCETVLFGDYHVEHMQPLSRGGSNDWTNIALTCGPCNLRKHTKTTEEFMEVLMTQ